MGILYLAALVVGLGTILVQLAMSSSGGDAHGDLHGGADANAAHHAEGKDLSGGAGALALFISMRFWTFGLMAFGIVGTLLHYLQLASPVLVAPIALAMGLGSGLLASWTFRALARATTSSAAERGDTVGQVGRVLVPLGKQERGKVRIEVRGQTVDWVATTDEADLEEGAQVLVEDVRGTTVHVSRAPDGLGPGSNRGS